MSISRRKFLFFLVIDQVFQILRFVTVLNVVYHPISSPEKPLFHKRIPSFLYVCTFARIGQYYFSKYLGDQCMGRPPTSNFWGDRPPSPPRSPPLLPMLREIGITPVEYVA